MDKKKDKVYSNGKMVIHIKENSKIIKFMELALTFGMIKNIIKEIGKTIKCMEKGY